MEGKRYICMQDWYIPHTDHKGNCCISNIKIASSFFPKNKNYIH